MKLNLSALLVKLGISLDHELGSTIKSYLEAFYLVYDSLPDLDSLVSDCISFFCFDDTFLVVGVMCVDTLLTPIHEFVVS